MKIARLVPVIAIFAVQARSVPPAFAPASTLLEQYVDAHKIAGAVAAVAQHGKIVYLDAIGVQDLASATPMQERSLFRIYSMTKSVTAVAAMMLFKEGRFRLSDPVSKYLPAFTRVVVLRRSKRRAAAARPRDHRRGSIPSHVGSEPSHLGGLPPRTRSIARYSSFHVHRQHRARATHGGSGRPLSI
jgi:CubicO group peptidase (beta-lactamase class C family)